MNPISGKVAIITGGGTGIGRAVALSLAQAGARTVICGRRQAPLDETIELVKSSLAGHTPEAVALMAIQADVSDEDQVNHLVQTALDAFGTVDILVNNAGIDGGGEIHAHDIATWDRILAVNLRGPFLMARAVLPGMRAKKSGHLINISSESGLEHYTEDGAYGVSKHALNALSEYIQRENQELGIRVDTICPGMVVTEMTADSPGLIHEKCLFPEDIADLVLWVLTRRPNIKIGSPILIQTMENPWES
jgi:NAD(P)-dependent dehydrogenase (short-subunit alcohol dehydrogenase family)